MMLALEPSLKKKKGAKFFELDEDIDQDWIKEHQNALIEEQRQKIMKKFEKENEKLAADGQKEMKAKELEERLAVLKEMEKKFTKENKTSKVEPEGKGPTIDRLEGNIEKLDQRIATMSLQAEDKESNKEVALGTSKIVRVCLSRKENIKWPILLIIGCDRITLILVLPLCLPRSLMFPSRSSSLKLSGRNSIGQSNQQLRIGNSDGSIYRVIMILSSNS